MPRRARGAPTRTLQSGGCRGLERGAASRPASFAEVEREDEIARLIRLPDAIFDLDDQPALLGRRFLDGDLQDVDARLASSQRFLDDRSNPLNRGAVERVEDHLVDAAPEIRTHDAFTRRRLEDDPNRLTDVLLVLDAGHETRAGLELDGHRPAAAEEILAVGGQVF